MFDSFRDILQEVKEVYETKSLGTQSLIRFGSRVIVWIIVCCQKRGKRRGMKVYIGYSLKYYPTTWFYGLALVLDNIPTISLFALQVEWGDYNAEIPLS